MVFSKSNDLLVCHQYNSLQSIPVSCSIGVSVRWDGNDGTIPDALQRADKALYVAKEMGRNRVVAAWTLNDRSKKIV